LAARLPGSISVGAWAWRGRRHGPAAALMLAAQPGREVPARGSCARCLRLKPMRPARVSLAKRSWPAALWLQRWRRVCGGALAAALAAPARSSALAAALAGCLRLKPMRPAAAAADLELVLDRRGALSWDVKDQLPGRDLAAGLALPRDQLLPSARA
jgi:hypothetical protein